MPDSVNAPLLFHPAADAVYGFPGARCLARVDSAWQRIEVWDTPQLGCLFTLDGRPMTSAGDEFVFEPQDFYIGTLKAGDMYTADIKVDSVGDGYNSTPQFTLVYRNGDNWHQTPAVSVATHPARKTWWDNWWPYLVGGAICLVALVGIVVTASRRLGKGKSH